MCGRYVSAATADQVAAFFDVDEQQAPELGARFNVAPTTPIYAVMADRCEDQVTRVLRAVRWGLVPRWATSSKLGAQMINARAETIATKPAFRKAIVSRRCLVPADGYYEWKSTPGRKTKQPFYIRAVDGAPLALAGIWERRRDEAGGELLTCAIITTEANDAVRAVHHRMPALIQPEDWQYWLDPANTEVDNVTDLLVPAAGDLLAVHPVSTAVNKVSEDGPDLIAPADRDESIPELGLGSAGTYTRPPT